MAGLSGRELQLATVDFTVEVNGATFTWDSFQGITLESGRARNLVKNKVGRNTGWTLGDEDNGSPQLSGVLVSEVLAFKAWLASVAPGKKLTEVTWNASVTMGEGDHLYTDKIEAAAFTKDPRNFGSDQQAARVDMPFTPLHIHGHGGDAV